MFEPEITVPNFKMQSNYGTIIHNICMDMELHFAIGTKISGSFMETLMSIEKLIVHTSFIYYLC